MIARDGAVPAVTPLVAMRAIRRSFGGVQALKGVDLELRPGEVHGLVGANGAGKSTAIRILAGVDAPDAGTISVDGVETTIPTPQRAAEFGFSFVHQELNLVTGMTALENIVLGSRKPHLLGLLDWRRIAASVAPSARIIGIDFPLRTAVANLSVGQRWLVSICRALVRKARLIVMDEPTASLSVHETENLFRVVDTLRGSGIGLLYVSHRLQEILDLCDRVTAFRDGVRVMHKERLALTRGDLVEAIVGSALEIPPASDRASTEGPVLLRVRGLARRPAVRGVDLDLRRGEVLGLGGLVGAGRTELVRLLYGADRRDAGVMTLEGRPFAPRDPHDAVRRGLGLVPEERRAEGLILTRSVMFNMTLSSNWRFATAPFGLLRQSRRAGWAATTGTRLAIKMPSVHAPVQSLSGGNQQKVVIGRWLDRNLKVLILDEPTRGVDIGARGEIHRLIRGLAGEGLSVIVVSSEPEELPDMCDRVLVLAEGRIVAALSGAAATRDAVVRASYAESRPAEAIATP